MAKKGKAYVVARIEQLRAQGFSKREAGQMAYREAGHGKSKARSFVSGKQGSRGVGCADV